MNTMKAYPVAAARYLHGAPKVDGTGRPATRTHIVRTVDGDWLEVLCRRVRVDSLLIDGALAESPEWATCPACRSRWARILTGEVA